MKSSQWSPRPIPCDVRLARWLVRPLVRSPVTPNHLTTLRLLVGVAGVALIASDGYMRINLGMTLVALSNFIDHTDGELARLSGRSSRFGNFYDLGCDLLITVLLFVCIGVSLTDNGYGGWSVALGVLSGLSVTAIFFMRMQIEEREGKAGVRQPALLGFELKDVLYLLPLVSLASLTEPFLLAAAAGAPLFALWVLREYVNVFGDETAGLRRNAGKSPRP